MRGKRILASVLAVCICITGVLTLTPVTVEAKESPKLSSKSVLLAAGGKQTITLKNGSGKWSVKDDSIAKIAKKTGKSVVIKPVKAGTTFVYCKAGKKKLSCKVKVVNERIGDPLTELGYAVVVGKSTSIGFSLPADDKIISISYDKKKGKVTEKSSVDPDTGETQGTMKIKALKPGRFTLSVETQSGSTDTITYALSYVINELPPDQSDCDIR